MHTLKRPPPPPPQKRYLPLMRHHPVCACAATPQCYRVPAIFPIAYTCLLPSCPLCSHLIYFYPYILPTFGGTRTAASRGPPPEPDDRPQNQTTVARTDDRPQNRRPSPEQTTVPRQTTVPELTTPRTDRPRQNRRPVPRTRTTPRTRRQPFEPPASESTINSIDRLNRTRASILARHQIESNQLKPLIGPTSPPN